MQLRRPLQHRLWRFAFTLASVAGLTGCLLVLREFLGPTALALCYVPLVLIVAIQFDRSAAVLASFASFLTYNFFFVPPFYTLTVEHPQDIVELFIFLGVSLVAGALASREHVLSQAATRRAEQMTALYNLSQEVSAAVDSAVILPVIARAALTVLSATGVEIMLAARGNTPEATIRSGICHGSEAYTVLIVAGRQTLGELRVWGLYNPLAPGDETSTLVTTIANHVALTVERAEAAAAIYQSLSVPGSRSLEKCAALVRFT